MFRVNGEFGLYRLNQRYWNKLSLNKEKVMSKKLILSGNLSRSDLLGFSFQRHQYEKIEVSKDLLEKSQNSHAQLMQMVREGIPIYGVTTGFGDSSTNYVSEELSERLQFNLIQYLTCGLGDIIPVEASRAMFLIRLNSLAQGYSAVSKQLLAHMANLLSFDIIPAVPRQGSLGASGDLVPLAYLGQVIQGLGVCHYQGKILKTEEVFKINNIEKYKFKPKEALAVVNGTSTMAGLTAFNLCLAQELLNLSTMTTAWQCLVLNGKREAFNVFINEIAKTNPGQGAVARKISTYLDAENYKPLRGQDIKVKDLHTEGFVQDRYSLRCVPQILGPILENLEASWKILDHEIKIVTDNPVINSDGQLEMGGNFYGGYLCQAMDFTKINMAHLADLMDRQVAMLIDEKSNRGLPANLIDSSSIDTKEKNMHHGLKGVHQATSAITSEIMQMSIPSGIFSRSSESHNQDKVSLGMSAASTCHDLIQSSFRVVGLQLVCLAQAIDLRRISLVGTESKKLYELVRKHVPFVDKDQELGPAISALIEDLKRHAFTE